MSSRRFFFVRQIWDSLFFDFHGLLCRLLPLDAQGTDLTKWWLPLDLGDISYRFLGGVVEKLPSYIKGLCHKRHKHVTKPWNKDPGTWANHDGSCHVSGFVSRWWACFLGFSYPLEGTRRRFSEALLGYVILFGVDFVNPYCEHEIQFTTWKTAVAVSFHELTPITSKPVTWNEMVLPMFSRYSFFGGGRNISIFLGQSFGIWEILHRV